MNILWAHEMGYKPDLMKIEIIKNFNLKPFYLHLDYENNNNCFDILFDYCIENKIDFLIGSSYGGFLCYWLSEKLGIPCLLLNPALSLRTKNKTKPNIEILKSKLCLVALSANDEVIDYNRTLLFLENDSNSDKIIKTKIYESEKHIFSNKTFEIILKWALFELNLCFKNN